MGSCCCHPFTPRWRLGLGNNSNYNPTRVFLSLTHVSGDLFCILYWEFDHWWNSLQFWHPPWWPSQAFRFQCSFCSMGGLFGTRWTFKSVIEIITTVLYSIYRLFQGCTKAQGPLLEAWLTSLGAELSVWLVVSFPAWLSVPLLSLQTSQHWWLPMEY